MTKTNDKSCMLDAVKLAVGADLLSVLGHDGSERGYHTEEIKDALEVYGMTLVRHELYPCLQLPGGKVVPVFTKEKAAQRFEDIFDRGSPGVLVCRSPKGVNHAYGRPRNSLRDKVMDPAMDGQLVDISQLDIVMFLEILWR
jgi:hypothetical protein